MIQETGRELRELIRKINSRFNEESREEEQDDAPELPPVA
jgi:hypothetical protein